MSATVARQGGRVQLEQSDMRLALNILQNGQRRLFARRNRGNEISHYEITRRGLRRDEAGCWVSWAQKGEGCDTMTPGNASSRPNVRLPSMPKWHHKESADTLETQKKQVHLHQTDAESRLQSRLRHCPARHPPQPVTLLKFNLLKSSICPADIRIRIQLFPVQNFSMMRKLSTIRILIQIC